MFWKEHFECSSNNFEMSWMKSLEDLLQDLEQLIR